VNTYVHDYWARRKPARDLLTQESSDVIDWLSSTAGQSWLNHNFRKPWGSTAFFSVKIDKPGDSDSDWTAEEIRFRWPLTGYPSETFPALTEEDVQEPHP
jgi:hypothetical protein